MALDLEEQEQLETLKAWWQTNGGFVLAVVLAVLLTVGGWFGWRNYQASRAFDASTLYDGLVRAVQAGDPKLVRDAGGALAANYPNLLYASMGALVAARFHHDRGDDRNAKAQLQWVVEHAATEDFRSIARLRLAALLLDAKAYAEALAQLDAPHEAAFDAQFAALRGDVETARGKASEAKAAYRMAIEKAPRGDTAFVDRVRMRLEALGG